MMAQMFGAAVVLCLILAGTYPGLAQDPTQCMNQAEACLLNFQRDYSDAVACRAIKKYFNCVKGITVCGELYNQMIQLGIDNARKQLRDVGCVITGAEGTAVVSTVTLLLSLAAALVWGQS